MTWFRVDDGLADHPKILDLFTGPTPEASIALWVLAGSWCAKHLTDGQVPLIQVRRLGFSEEAAAELVRVGLWLNTECGYAFHEWTDQQPTKSQVKARRARDAERKAQARDKRESAKSPRGVTADVRTESARSPHGHDRPPAQPVRSTRPDPTRPDPDSPKGESQAGRRPPPADDTDDRIHARSLLRIGWSDHWLKHTASPASPAQLDAVAKLATWLLEYRKRCPERSIEWLAGTLLERFFVAKETIRRPSVEWLAEDPGRYLDDKPAPKVRRKAEAESRREAELDQRLSEMDRAATPPPADFLSVIKAAGK